VSKSVLNQSLHDYVMRSVVRPGGKKPKAENVVSS